MENHSEDIYKSQSNRLGESARLLYEGAAFEQLLIKTGFFSGGGGHKH